MSLFRHLELYLDEDVDVLIADLLKAYGFSALTTRDAESELSPEETIHLMVQTILDRRGLGGSEQLLGFRENRLPKTTNLETVPKRDVEHSLSEATERTKKKSYHKIRHASDLLKRIDAEKVRCTCRRVFEALGRIVECGLT